MFIRNYVEKRMKQGKNIIVTGEKVFGIAKKFNWNDAKRKMQLNGKEIVKLINNEIVKRESEKGITIIQAIPRKEVI